MRTPFHIMTKPIGPICNLDCKYCFYLEKENFYPAGEKWRMPEPVLESYVRQYIESQDQPEVAFAWQGGEPTLLGIDFFRRVVDLQRKHAGGKTISNAFQTNGILLDDHWCRFLRDERFLVGISIDGPRELHDRWRLDKQQRPTFDAVMRGIDLLKMHRVDFNTLTVVSSTNAEHPTQVYRFLKQAGSGFMQFIPLVERQPSVELRIRGRHHSEPPEPGQAQPPTTTAAVMPWSVRPWQYGNFLVEIFDEWVQRDVGRAFVQIFDVALGIWAGVGSSLCLFTETCGNALALEHDGQLYSCDHFVYPQYHLGSILDRPLAETARSEAQRKFGQDKRDTLPAYCRRCDVRFACNGECPKNRFERTPDGEDGLNYLCPGYKRFFHHIDPYMKVMTQLLRSGRPAALVMEVVGNLRRTVGGCRHDRSGQIDHSAAQYMGLQTDFR